LEPRTVNRGTRATQRRKLGAAAMKGREGRTPYGFKKVKT
jgi:hypothetical protein